MTCKSKVFVTTVLATFALTIWSPHSHALDAAAKWAESCARCHGIDTATYAKAELRLIDNVLVLSSNPTTTVASVLTQGHGRIDAEGAKDMIAYLTKQIAPK